MNEWTLEFFADFWVQQTIVDLAYYYFVIFASISTFKRISGFDVDVDLKLSNKFLLGVLTITTVGYIASAAYNFIDRDDWLSAKLIGILALLLLAFILEITRKKFIQKFFNKKFLKKAESAESIVTERRRRAQRIDLNIVRSESVRKEELYKDILMTTFIKFSSVFSAVCIATNYSTLTLALTGILSVAFIIVEHNSLRDTARLYEDVGDGHGLFVNAG